VTTLKSGSGCDPGDGSPCLQEKGSPCFPGVTKRDHPQMLGDAGVWKRGLES